MTSKICYGSLKVVNVSILVCGGGEICGKGMGKLLWGNSRNAQVVVRFGLSCIASTVNSR